MSKQHLFKFQKESDYSKAMDNHLTLPSISYVVETKGVHIDTAFTTRENAEAGDIIAFHENDNGEVEVAYIKPEAYDAEGTYWTPDAVVVVPASHTADGSVRAMAIDADYENTYRVILDRLPTYGVYGLFMAFNDPDEQYAESTKVLSTECTMPSTSFKDGKKNKFDTKTYYPLQYGKILPSPYNNDGTMNDAYHSKGDFSSFSDSPASVMDGSADTMTISECVGYDSSIAAVKCTEHSSVLRPRKENETVWYQPSAGEIGYYMARKERIDYALEKIGHSIPSNVDKLSTSTISFDTGLECVCLSMDGNMTLTDAKSYGMYVIPFCKY